MPDHDEVAPVIQLYPQKPYGPEEMSRWFRRLATSLAEEALDISPEAFVLVLINDEALRVWSAGPTRLRDEAAQAAVDARQHRRYPAIYDAPEVRRARRRTRKLDNEAATPWVCEVCQQRMATRRDYDRHQAPGHRCMTCDQVYLTVAAWEAHPCVATPLIPVQLRVVSPQRAEGDPE